MDMYLSAQDGFNLQEMLDCDIKCEMDDSFGFDGDLPPLDLEDDSKHAWVQGNSNSSFELDFFNGDCSASLMVNPNSIMPLPSMQLKRETETEVDMKPMITNHNLLKRQSPSPISPGSLQESQQTIKVVATSILSSNINNNNNSSSKRSITTVNNSNGESQQPTTPVSNNKIRKTPVVSSRKQLCINESMCYPKPAYSYSCLIAMALKNSRSGSLPVSEIYNFMCDHFPYFKTAPNGWKNSVRHNLSLNKCFEKIEKPVSGPGGTQRKGCLWAMNPAKVAKMDDEVAKWSRRDPLAIKKAMLNPENLEMLERGEMKVGRAQGDFDSEVDVEEEEFNEPSNTEQEEEEGNNEDEDEEDEENKEEEDDDEPQPIGSDESDDELSRMPPSLQPFEPRLALLNRHLNDSNNESRLPNNLSELNMEIIDEYGVEYEELDVDESRAFLGLNSGSPKFIDSEDESDSEESTIGHQTTYRFQKEPMMMMLGKKRKANTSLIQGNYVCVKRKLSQPSISCRSVN